MNISTLHIETEKTEFKQSTTLNSRYSTCQHCKLHQNTMSCYTQPGSTQNLCTLLAAAHVSTGQYTVVRQGVAELSTDLPVHHHLLASWPRLQVLVQVVDRFHALAQLLD